MNGRRGTIVPRRLLNEQTAGGLYYYKPPAASSYRKGYLIVIGFSGLLSMISSTSLYPRGKAKL